MDSGNLAWAVAATALVLFMTPGVAFFYGGMVKAKSVISMMMMSFGAIALSISGGTVEVLVVVGGAEERFAAPEAEDAYALALLHYVDSSLRLDEAEPTLTLDDA